MTAALQHQEPSQFDPAAGLADTPEEQRAAAASHLAHDARNWLTVLQVYCGLLRSSGTVSGHGRAWLEELSHAVERGEGLVTSLLDSGQASTPPDSAAMDPTAAGPTTLDLAVVLQKRMPLFRKMAGSAIRVESQTAAHAETTALRESELDRILLNLVCNGIDAMPRGGRLKLEVETGDGNERRPLTLRVSDTGDGIPVAILNHIFDSGFSTKSTARKTKSGRGYGLAIVRDLTLAAGGSVRVRSTIGQGTCFTIELPAPPAAATDGSTISQPRNAAVDAKTTKRTPVCTRQSNNFGAVRKGTRVPC